MLANRLELCEHVFLEPFRRACFSAYHTEQDVYGRRFPSCRFCDGFLVSAKRELDEGVAVEEDVGEFDPTK